MTAMVPHQSYMTQHPSLFTLINHCVIAFSFALMFTIVVGLLSAMVPCSSPVCWLTHMKQQTIVHFHLFSVLFGVLYQKECFRILQCYICLVDLCEILAFSFSYAFPCLSFSFMYS